MSPDVRTLVTVSQSPFPAKELINSEVIVLSPMPISVSHSSPERVRIIVGPPELILSSLFSVASKIVPPKVITGISLVIGKPVGAGVTA